MKKFYAKSTCGFYDSSIHTSMPSDVIEVTDAQWRAAIDGQAQGKVIQPNASGIPVADDPPSPSAAQVKASANASIQSQIDALEKSQPRTVREAAIGTAGAVDRLKALDAQIAVLRAKFIK